MEIVTSAMFAPRQCVSVSWVGNGRAAVLRLQCPTQLACRDDHIADSHDPQTASGVRRAESRPGFGRLSMIDYSLPPMVIRKRLRRFSARSRTSQ